MGRLATPTRAKDRTSDMANRTMGRSHNPKESTKDQAYAFKDIAGRAMAKGREVHQGQSDRDDAGLRRELHLTVSDGGQGHCGEYHHGR
jgi:hypothetical protein